MIRIPRFQRGVFVCALAWLAGLAARADPLITEFMASNTKTLADIDGDFSDWIELFNPDASSVDLNGWYLTDDATDKKKWKFPAVSLPAGGYLVVFASGKDRNDPTKQLHTNFSLSTTGEYLALVKPDGVTVTSEFAPKFPAQFDDVSYGVTQPTVAGEAVRTGYFRPSTPGAKNGGASSLMLVETVTLSRASGPFTGSITLAMTGASGGQRIRYVTVSPSTAGAVAPEPTATSTEYAGPITLSSSVIVRASIFSADNSQRGLPTTAHYMHLASSGSARLDTFASQLPLLVIDTHGTGLLSKTDGEKSAWVYTWDRPAAGGTALTSTPTAATFGTTNVRGQSSADFPKRSFALKFTNQFGTSNPVGPYGLPAFDSWDLIGPWNYDKTYLHNVFTYALSNRIGRWAPRTQLVEVFFNGNGGDLDYSDYNGIYVLTDALKVDSKRVDITPLSPGDTGTHSITGGYFLHCDLIDPDEFSFTTTHGYPGPPGAVAVKAPVAASLPKSQRDYIQGYIQGYEDALYADQGGGFQQHTYTDYIDRGSFIDHHILNVLTSNVDAFFRSAYMTKDRDGRLTAGPMWDNDRSMNGGDDRTKDPTIWSGPDGATPFWDYGWWAVMAHDPEWMQAWIDRWQGLRKTEFADATLTSLLDLFAAQIDAAAATRDAAKWPENASRYGGAWQGEVNNMKTWLTQRAAWIDSQFTAPPTITSAGGNVTLTPAAGTQLAYTTDGSDPRAIGGALATAAKLSATSVTLSDSTDVQVRGYKASVNPSVVPGSRWSMRLGGPQSSPIKNFPAITAQPVAQTVAAGSTVVFSVDATNSPGYQWQRNGANVPLSTAGANDATLILTNVSAAQAGTYTVNVTNGLGSAKSTAVNLNVVSTTDVGRLINLSVLTDVSSAVPNFTLGTVVSGPDASATKPLVVRAVGPALGALGVLNTLADPKLDLFAGQTVVASNDNWGGAADLATAMASVGAFAFASPLSKDAALYRPALAPRDYTVAVSGVGGATGAVIAEIYDATPAGTFTSSSSRLINLSVLKQVNAGGAITLGFTIGGATGKTILVRAIGPGLAQLGVPNAMGDPKLSLFNSSSAVIAKNDDWGGDAALSLMMARVNAFAITSKDSKDAMLLITLPPGGYTAQATPSAGAGAAGGGLVIVEVYEVP